MRVQRQRKRLRRCDDGPEEFATMAEASAEGDEPKDSTTTTEASSEEAEETTRLSERLQWQRRRYVYGHRELTTTAVVVADEDRPKDSVTTT